MKKILLLLGLAVTLFLPAFAQGPSSDRKIDNDFVQRQFGDQFTLVPEVPPVFGDLDGDGVEDVVIAARCKNPMLDQGDHHYTVVDPYYDFFGYGDPKLTTTFIEPDAKLRGLTVLIIHGAGKDAWRTDNPRMKFVIVNLPYKTISVRKMRMRKKTIEAIYVEEAGEFGDTSAVFFDGRKFRYVPMGGDME